MRRNNKKVLYEKIMRNVSKEVKRILNEDYGKPYLTKEMKEILRTVIKDHVMMCVNDSNHIQWYYEDFIFNENEDGKFNTYTQSIFDSDYCWNKLQPIFDPWYDYDNGTDFFDSLVYEKLKEIAEFNNSVVNEIISPDEDWTNYCDEEYLNDEE